MSLEAKNRVDLISRFLILIVVMAIMAVLQPGAFLNWNNLSQVIFQQTPFTLLMAFGMSLAIISNGIDISMASNMVLSSYLSGPFFSEGNYLVGILVAVGVGVAFGLLNGILTAKIKIEPGTQAGKVLRLRGKGVPDVNGYGRGDLLVVVNIPIPAKVNAEEKRLLEQLSQGDNFKEAAPTAGGNLFDRMKSFFR